MVAHPGVVTIGRCLPRKSGKFSTLFYKQTSSARISRYETGVHEPPFAIAVLLSNALHVPAAFFYCENDDMAQLVVGFASLPTPARTQLLEVLSQLSNA
jgi:transcriptional regulator with XRE-family HTH domain